MRSGLVLAVFATLVQSVRALQPAIQSGVDWRDPSPHQVRWMTIEVYLASFARTFKEAQQYMGFVIMVPMLGLMGGMAFPEVTGLWLAPVPIFEQFELAKAILAGESPAVIWHVVSALSLAGCTAALILLTARLFSSEKLIIGR